MQWAVSCGRVVGTCEQIATVETRQTRISGDRRHVSPIPGFITSSLDGVTIFCKIILCRSSTATLVFMSRGMGHGWVK